MHCGAQQRGECRGGVAQAAVVPPVRGRLSGRQPGSGGGAGGGGGRPVAASSNPAARRSGNDRGAGTAGRAAAPRRPRASDDPDDLDQVSCGNSGGAPGPWSGGSLPPPAGGWSGPSAARALPSTAGATSSCRGPVTSRRSRCSALGSGDGASCRSAVAAEAASPSSRCVTGGWSKQSHPRTCCMQVGIAALAWTAAGCRGADLHAPPRQGRREAGCSSDARQIGSRGQQAPAI